MPPVLTEIMCYASATTRCLVLTYMERGRVLCYAISGTDLAYVIRICDAMSGTNPGIALPGVCHANATGNHLPIMPGIDRYLLAYAMSGTAYAIPGTDLLSSYLRALRDVRYRASVWCNLPMRCPVLTLRMVLPVVKHASSLLRACAGTLPLCLRHVRHGTGVWYCQPVRYAVLMC
eukprot:2913903-Rhodomonas_salina.3